MVKTTRNQKIGIGAVLLLLVLVGSGLFSIVGLNAARNYPAGGTVAWTTDVDSATVTALNAKLGCSSQPASNYIRTSITATSVLICDGSNIATSGSAGYTYYSCNNNGGSGAIPGEFSATIPLTAKSCYISATYTATIIGYDGQTFPSPSNVWKGKTASQTDISSLEQRTLTIFGTNECSAGQKGCNSQQTWTCVNNKKVFPPICQKSCTNGACDQVCIPNSLECYGTAQVYVCNSAGTTKTLQPASGSGASIGSTIICSDNKIQQRCSDGTIKTLAESCTSTSGVIETKVTCPDGSSAASYSACPAWCGDGKCSSSESVSTCSRDCASTPVQCAALDVSQDMYDQLIMGYKAAELKSRGVALSTEQANAEYRKVYPTDTDICQNSGYFEIKEVSGCGVCSPFVSKIKDYSTGGGSGTGTKCCDGTTRATCPIGLCDNPGGNNTTNTCGNSRCDASENIVSCPQDCILPDKTCTMNGTSVKLGACTTDKVYRCALNATDNSSTVFAGDSTCTTNPDKVPDVPGGAQYDIKLVLAGMAVVVAGGYYFLVMRKKKGTKR